MKQFIILILVMKYSFAHEPSCNEIELIKGQRNYNELVCNASTFFKTGLFNKALSEYLEASEIKFYEAPNYSLNTKIAKTYLFLGNLQQANIYIKRSEIVLNLLAGIYSCKLEGSTYTLIGRNNIIETDPNNTYIAKKMCGVSYDYIYNNKSKTLKSVLRDGRLVENYLYVRSLIEKREKLNKK